MRGDGSVPAWRKHRPPGPQDEDMFLSLSCLLLPCPAFFVTSGPLHGCVGAMSAERGRPEGSGGLAGGQNAGAGAWGAAKKSLCCCAGRKTRRPERGMQARRRWAEKMRCFFRAALRRGLRMSRGMQKKAPSCPLPPCSMRRMRPDAEFCRTAPLREREEGKKRWSAGRHSVRRGVFSGKTGGSRSAWRAGHAFLCRKKAVLLKM